MSGKIRVWGPFVRDKAKGVYYVRWNSPDGKQVWRSLRTRDKSEARRLAVEVERQLNAAQPVSAPKPKGLAAAQAWELYLARMGARLKDSTLRPKRRSWLEFTAAMGNRPLECITADDLLAWRETMVAKGLAPRTVNFYTARIASVFTTLVRWELLERNPFRHLEQFPVATEPRPWLRKEQLVDLIEEARRVGGTRAGEGMFEFVLLAALFGLRRSEVAACRWGWLTFPSEDHPVGMLRVPSVDGRWRPKTRWSARTIPMSSTAARLLGPLRGDPRDYVVLPHIEWNLPMTQRWSWEAWGKVWHACVAAAGCPGITAHILRHTFASNAAQNGVDLYRLREYLGHKDLSLLTTYAHLCPRDRAVDRIYGDLDV